MKPKNEKRSKKCRKSTDKTGKTGKRKLSNLVKPDQMGVEEWQIELRKQIAIEENFGINYVNKLLCPGEYLVSNSQTRSDYKVVYRGVKSKWNYCSCMDFKTSQLGTCKHIEAVKLWLGSKVQRTIPSYTSVYLSYRHKRKVCIRIGTDNQEQFKALSTEYFDSNDALLEQSFDQFEVFLRKAHQIDDTFRCYKDAISFVLEYRDKKRRSELVRHYENDTLNTLLTVPLFPYQCEGARFSFKAGKSIIADEMGLGKTIQAIATAEMMKQEKMISSVLIVCPTSLKYQWKCEIERFTGRKNEVIVIEGGHHKRCEQYESGEFYKIVSYNSMSNDVKILGSLSVDMLIMDEVQRIKNWKTQMSAAARRIESQYTVILSGTPLENKLDELFSVVELVDQFCLSPYYKFKKDHVILDESGRVIGYKNLNAISRKLSEVMIRRTKKEVALQMPKRTDTNIFVPMTQNQMDIHDELKASVARIIYKWRQYHYLSEQDRKRILLLLSSMRMVCDSTYILDQKTRFDTKIDELLNILNSIFSSANEKVVIFSQWERMTRLIAQELDSKSIKYSYLTGSIPSAKRKDLVSDFTDNPDTRIFLSTDAGCTGLNLQAASTVINIDLPWNPAVLEQRIARIYRIGQLNNIQVINLVSPFSVEENMIGKLKFKASMFEGALDGGEDTIFISDDKFSKIVNVIDDLIEEDQQQSEIEMVAETETILDLPESEENDFLPQDPIYENKNDIESKETRDYTDNIDKKSDTTEPTSPHEHTVEDIDSGNTEDVISNGLKFLTGLAAALKTEEGKEKLVNQLVKTDASTGKTSLNIPIPDKQTVKQLLDLVGKLLG